jgi:hypothetical protein
MAKRAMERKGRIRWWALIFAIVLLAVLGGYFLGMEHGRDDAQTAGETEKTSSPGKEVPAKPEPEPVATQAPVVSQEIVKQTPETREDDCKRIDKDVRNFFAYLDTRDYIRHIEEGGTDTFDHFRKIVSRLASKLPIPAGEGADVKVLNSNIYHLFRILERKDIRLIREVIANESETLEMNIELFHRWLTLGNRCPDPEALRPSHEALYHHAGFFLNTIGGRAYLFRRPLRLRMLGTYYSLLIIHEADKEGRNLYGIDLYPHITPLAAEVELYPGLRYQHKYLEKLEELEKYYQKRR